MKNLIKALVKAFLINNKFLPPVKYAIIEVDNSYFGFFAHFINICGDLNEALRKNQKPFIDMKKNKSIYMRNDEVGKVNAWERYFQQPFPEISHELMDIRKSRQVIRWINNIYFVKVKRQWCGIKIMHYPDHFARPNDSMDFLTNEIEINYWRKFVHKYIKVNPEVEIYINNLKEKINFKEQDGIVGILVRGTDFINKKPYNHPVPPTAQEVLKKVQSVMKQFNCNRVFLATEDLSIYKFFNDNLEKNILISVPQVRHDDTQNEFLNEIYEKEDLDLYHLGLEYVATVLLLSKCRCLLSSRTSGGIAALIMSEGYEYTYFWNKGRYGVNGYMHEFNEP
ncbi:hypothetical protein [Eisenbergiella sp.]